MGGHPSLGSGLLDFRCAVAGRVSFILKVIDAISFATVQTVGLPASGSVAFTRNSSCAYAPIPGQNAVATFSTQ